jgi:hypothetical protein
MSYEDSAGINVKNHYGPRAVGGAMGVARTEGIKNEVSVNFDGDAFDFLVEIPAGAVVTHVLEEFSTGAVSAATVGVVDISGADGAEANYVAVPVGGELTITGPTAGTVIVYFLNVA